MATTSATTNDRRLPSHEGVPRLMPAGTTCQHYRIATINVATIRSQHKLELFRNMIYGADIDIALLQEVYVAEFSTPYGFTSYISHASDTGSGVAILLREGLPAEDVLYLPNARGMALTLFGVRIVNVYAPSGSSHHRERLIFFAEEVTPLFLGPHNDMILGGDFNSTQRPQDQLPHHSPCAALEPILSRLQLVDTWRHVHGDRLGFTYYTAHSSSRLDRIYISRPLIGGTRQAEIWPVAFSDHEAYFCDVVLTRQAVWHGRGFWKMNVAHLASQDCRRIIEDTWITCQRRRQTYPSTISWWIHCAKPALRKTLICYGKDVADWKKSTMDFYYRILRDCSKMPYSPERHIMMKRAKAQILVLMRRHLDGVVVRSRTDDRMPHEQPSMYHILKDRRHRRRNLIYALIDEEGRRYDTQSTIGHALYNHYKNLYAEVLHSPELIEEVSRLTFGAVSGDVANELIAGVTADEVLDAIRAGSVNRSPGPDGLPLEFYRTFRDLLVPTFTSICQELMSPEVCIPEAFMEGIIVPVHKPNGGIRISDYRPITLLNSDMKIFTRLLAARLRHAARCVVSSDQASLGGDNNIRVALCRYRDMIAMARAQRLSGALASLDFSQAFDRIDHSFLMSVLRHMGFPDVVITILMRLLKGASSRILYNGRLTPPIVIGRSVRQGCPLSAILFAFALEPLLCGFRQRLLGLSFDGHRFCCTAYADDVVICVRNVDEVRAALSWVATYGEASGSLLNVRKSHAMFIGSGLPAGSVVPLIATDSIHCLGIDFSADLRRSAAFNCRRLLQRIRAGLLEHRFRSLDILQRVRHVNVYIASRVPHVAQVFPFPITMARRMLAAMASFVSNGLLFKVTYESLTLPRDRGGLGLYHVPDRARALYVSSQMTIWTRCPTSLTGLLLSNYVPASLPLPVVLSVIPAPFHYIRNLILDLRYLRLKMPAPLLLRTKAVYDVLQRSLPSNPIEQKYPHIDWRSVWRAVSSSFLDSDVQSIWYLTVNGKHVTRSRLHRIHLADSPLCSTCGVPDTDEHRFVCGTAADVWHLIRRIIAFLTRDVPERITPLSLLFPDRVYFPRAKTNAVNWIRGHAIHYLFGPTVKSEIGFWTYLTERHYVVVRHPKYRQYFSNFLGSAFHDPPRSWNVCSQERRT